MIFLRERNESTTTEQKSTGCGPKENSATVFGDWKENQKNAVLCAKTKAKEAAKTGCSGQCEGKRCVYVEKKNDAFAPEERVVVEENQNKTTKYRNKGRSEGTCVCE